MSTTTPTRKTAEHEDRRQPEWNVRVHGVGLLLVGLRVLAFNKLPQEAHANDRGNADANDDDEFYSHDLSCRKTGCPP